jgi:hypothetical protein
MKAKRTIFSALIVIGTMGIGTTAASAGQPVAGCPSDYQLAKASKFPQGETIDKNGDGYVCWTTIPTPPPNRNVIDNKYPR